MRNENKMMRWAGEKAASLLCIVGDLVACVGWLTASASLVLTIKASCMECSLTGVSLSEWICLYLAQLYFCLAVAQLLIISNSTNATWMSVVYPFIHLHKHPEWNRVLLLALACLQLCNIKPTIHEATFVAGDTATLLFVHAAHEISNATFCKLLENRQPVYFQAICRMYHVIFPCTAHTNNNVAVSPATKVASCMAY